MVSFGARFSEDRLYRYSLHRVWQPRLPFLCWILLNPSTADETRDDPTIRRCIARAINGGFGGIEIVNLFAWRSTYPNGLSQTSDPVGGENDSSIWAAAKLSSRVVVGWGKHGTFHGRDADVLKLIEPVCTPYALALNEDGTPVHPLYIPYRIEPKPLSYLRLLAERKN